MHSLLQTLIILLTTEQNAHYFPFTEYLTTIYSNNKNYYYFPWALHTLRAEEMVRVFFFVSFVIIQTEKTVYTVFPVTIDGKSTTFHTHTHTRLMTVLTIQHSSIY